VLGGELLVQALDRLGGGQQLSFQEQDETQATYAEKIEAADRLLDPACTAIELERVVRALHPHIGARLALPDGSMLGVHRAGAMPALDEVEVRQGELSVHGEHLLYGLASGQALELLEVQPAGGKAMDAKAYMRGHAF
jgi:methionyl-tRNA formyltransferase